MIHVQLSVSKRSSKSSKERNLSGRELVQLGNILSLISSQSQQCPQPLVRFEEHGYPCWTIGVDRRYSDQISDFLRGHLPTLVFFHNCLRRQEAVHINEIARWEPAVSCYRIWRWVCIVRTVPGQGEQMLTTYNSQLKNVVVGRSEKDLRSQVVLWTIWKNRNDFRLPTEWTLPRINETDMDTDQITSRLHAQIQIRLQIRISTVDQIIGSTSYCSTVCQHLQPIFSTITQLQMGEMFHPWFVTILAILLTSLFLDCDKIEKRPVLVFEM